MRLGINTFLFTSPFTNDSTRLFKQFKRWGFESIEIPIEDPSHIDPAKVKAALDKNGLVCGSVCACMGPGRDLRGTPAEQIARRGALLQSLLEDRFKLQVHRETRQLPRFALVLARKDGALGSRIRPAAADCLAEPARCETRSAPGQLTSTNMSMGNLAVYLASNVVQNVVVDRTGLAGFFALDLEWTADRAPLPLNGDTTPAPSDRPSIFGALQDQLGLKLETERGAVEVLVIDHVERPTED